MVEETSQIADLRTLSALVQERRPPQSQGTTPGTPMPAFGGASLFPPPLAASAPAALGPPPVPAVVVQTGKYELVPLYLLLVALALVVLAMSGYLLLQQRPVVIVEHEAPPPLMSEAAAVAMETQEDAVDDDPAEAVAPPPAPLPMAEPERADRKPGRRRGVRRPVRTTRAPENPKAAPALPKTSDVAVECILDPRQCERPKDAQATARPPKKHVEDLPTKLSQIQVKAGLAEVKSKAQACGAKHGATGVRVKAKISVIGKTGRVGSVKVADPYAGKQVGRCVGAALKQARFPRFSATAIGVEYSVRL